MTETQPVTIPASEIHLLDSDHVGGTFRVCVARPGQPTWPRTEPPPRILYVLDANIFFGMAVELSRLMHQLFGELPPLLVVGIAYDSDEARVHGELRTRDFTPSTDPSWEEMAGRTPTPFLSEDERMGRADRFLVFLTDELQPFVTERFDVSPEGSILFGSSLGGLFAMHTLLAQPAAFANYVIASPALWWNSGMLFDAEEAFATGHDDLDAGAFLCVGAREENPAVPMLARYQMVSNLRKMADLLKGRAYPSLRLGSQVFAEETHTSVVPVALTRGLREVAASPRS